LLDESSSPSPSWLVADRPVVTRAFIEKWNSEGVEPDPAHYSLPEVIRNSIGWLARMRACGSNQVPQALPNLLSIQLRLLGVVGRYLEILLESMGRVGEHELRGTSLSLCKWTCQGFLRSWARYEAVDGKHAALVFSVLCERIQDRYGTYFTYLKQSRFQQIAALVLGYSLFEWQVTRDTTLSVFEHPASDDERGYRVDELEQVGAVWYDDDASVLRMPWVNAHLTYKLCSAEQPLSLLASPGSQMSPSENERNTVAMFLLKVRAWRLKHPQRTTARLREFFRLRPSQPDLEFSIPVELLPEQREVGGVQLRKTVSSASYAAFKAHAKQHPGGAYGGYVNGTAAKFGDSMVLFPDLDIIFQDKQQLTSRQAAMQGDAVQQIPADGKKESVSAEHKKIDIPDRHILVYSTDATAGDEAREDLADNEVLITADDMPDNFGTFLSLRKALFVVAR
jgi:hypothetical protein